MNLLLDTQVVLWQLGGTRELSDDALTAIAAADGLYVSTVSFAEIGVKVALGKLSVPDEIVDATIAAGVRLLPLDAEHGPAVGALPLLHRDPFDRLLIAQATAEDLAIVTADRRIAAYPVPTVLA